MNRRVILAAMLVALASSPAAASIGSDRMKHCAATWRALSDAQRAATTYTTFSAHCLKSPAASGAPDGATGVCADGSYTFATHRGNVCYRHGGLARWLPHA